MIIDKNLENILLNGIKNKDDSAFEMLYKLAFPDLCNFAATFLKNKEIAKEIVQETFIKIWEKRDTLTIDTTLKGYLFRSVNNNCINYLKKNRKFLRLSDVEQNEILEHYSMASLNVDPTAIDRLISEEFERKIQDCINELPEQCKKVFLLSRHENLSYSQIAKELDLSENTIKTQIKRALQKLREVVKNRVD